jgi:hypothetical protein
VSDAPTGIADRSAAGTSPVRAAIAQAARATGTDFQYMLAQAKIESALNPEARAQTSSATGLYQFTRETWLRTLDAHGDKHGLGWASAAISGGRVTDPALAGQIMALRRDPQAAALMAGELAGDNRDALFAVLGREPDASELYLGHFLGSGGARTFLAALAQSPDTSSAALMPRAAAANRPIFYEASGAARSVREVMALIRDKVNAAMEPGAVPDEGTGFADLSRWAALGVPAATQAAPLPQSDAASSWQETARAPFAGRSMAETLRATFASFSANGSGEPPAAVTAAYTRLARFGL